jgi:bifunctional non-homologous end joining protein LigD
MGPFLSHKGRGDAQQRDERRMAELRRASQKGVRPDARRKTGPLRKSPRALAEYRRKRDFGLTPEPAGTPTKRPRAEAGPRFVIQKHAASRLHYDFRLELDGVLKSWAVPKGPSLDPREKRLAVHVEDHPIDYGGFEGVIPKGQYGGGTVLLWDRGTWRPEDGSPDAAYRKGSLKFTLDGEKLHGKWALVRMGGKAAREKHENWLLIKEKDAVAKPGSGAAVVDKNPLSVASGRDMATIAAEADRVWDSRSGERAPTKKTTAKNPAMPEGARKARMPATLKPQLATLVTGAPQGDGWLHEIKLDGYRILARLSGGDVTLMSRNGLDWTRKFPEIAAALGRLKIASAVLDGEIVALAENGQSSFARLQQALSAGDTGALVYYCFDLPYLDGRDLTRVALVERKAALRDLLAGSGDGIVRYADHQDARGPEFFQHACSLALEGIVSKQRDAPYTPGRGRLWLKVKCGNREEFVIIGFSDPGGTRQGFGSLLLGTHDGEGKLRYAGRVGTGFDNALLGTLRKKLDALARKTKPVATLPKGTTIRDVHWVAPELVAEIGYTEWTDDGVLRHPTFIGLGAHKEESEVVREAAQSPAPAAPSAAGKPAGKSASKSAGKSRGKSGAAPDGATAIAGIRLSNAGKLLYPDAGITKLDLARYYEAVAEFALPHLTARPLSLLRCPEGYTGECFFQKHQSAGMPPSIHRIEIAEKAGTETSLYIEDLAGLAGLVQMGVLEIHPWGSTVAHVETPDRLTFDFDPDVGLPWQRVVEGVGALRKLLDTLGLRSFLKTTGGKGLHVVVPVAPRLEWDEAKAFAKAVTDRLVATAPDRYTATLAKKARHGKIFVDYLRNGRGATAVGAYSARARAGATVSTPIAWDELAEGTRSDAFTIRTLPKRLAALRADPWQDFLATKQSITAAMRKAVRG